MCVCWVSVCCVSPRWCTSALYFWPRINIEMRIMHKSLHGDCISPPCLRRPQTASTVRMLFLSFSRRRRQLIHFQVLHKGDPSLSNPWDLTLSACPSQFIQTSWAPVLPARSPSLEWITSNESHTLTIQLLHHYNIYNIFIFIFIGLWPWGFQLVTEKQCFPASSYSLLCICGVCDPEAE